VIAYITRGLALCVGNAFLITWAVNEDAPRWFVVAGVWGIALWVLIATAGRSEDADIA
jgi:hypothetical protein